MINISLTYSLIIELLRHDENTKERRYYALHMILEEKEKREKKKDMIKVGCHELIKERLH